MSEPTLIRGIVRALNGQNALIEVEQGGCGRCHEKGGCGGQNISQMFCSGPKSYEVRNDIAAQVGERVHVAISAGSVSSTANLVYVLPLAAMLIGAVAGFQLHGDLAAIFGAILGLVLAFGFVRARSHHHHGITSDRQPHIVSRC